MDWKKIRKLGLTLISIFLCSFLLNYIWESLHAVFLYEGHNFKAEKYILMLLYVSVVDGLIILGIFFFIAFIWRDTLWLRKMKRKQAYTACMAGLVISAIIEYRKVLVLGEWSYTPLMPAILGIGVSPLLQLSATGLLALWLTQRFLYQRGQSE
jgi:hypothetical protein